MSFDFYNDVTSLVAYGSVVSEETLDVADIDVLLNEQEFQYKTNIEKSS